MSASTKTDITVAIKFKLRTQFVQNVDIDQGDYEETNQFVVLPDFVENIDNVRTNVFFELLREVGNAFITNKCVNRHLRGRCVIPDDEYKIFVSNRFNTIVSVVEEQYNIEISDTENIINVLWILNFEIPRDYLFCFNDIESIIYDNMNEAYDVYDKYIDIDYSYVYGKTYLTHSIQLVGQPYAIDFLIY